MLKVAREKLLVTALFFNFIEKTKSTYTGLCPLAIGADDPPNKGSLSLACLCRWKHARKYVFFIMRVPGATADNMGAYTLEG